MCYSCALAGFWGKRAVATPPHPAPRKEPQNSAQVARVTSGFLSDF